jgi:hypothetical protein
MYNEIFKNQLPGGLYVNDEVNKKEIRVLANALNRAQESIDHLEKEIIIATATHIGLHKKEEIFDLKTNKNKPVDQRRSHLVSRHRGNSNATVALIKSIAESFSNGEVDVIEDYPNYHFIIKFISTKGIPPNIDDLWDTIERNKHAHMGFNFQFTYTVWGEVKAKTWGQVKNGTWTDLRNK